jgi:hypothetical protein
MAEKPITAVFGEAAHLKLAPSPMSRSCIAS